MTTTTSSHQQKWVPRETMAKALEFVENFLFREFPSRATFAKPYERDSRLTTSEELDKRYKGYQKICLYGLGSVFWGAATGVLSNLQDKYQDWMLWGSIYFALSLVLMLNGLTAATFSSSTSFALSTAALGAWTAYIYMLATFHVASLQFHSNVQQCIYSMSISFLAVTFHWSFNSQDAVVLLILCKLSLWLILMMLYGVYVVVILLPRCIPNLIAWIFGVVRSLRGRVRKAENSRKSSLLANKSDHDDTIESHDGSATV